MKLHVVNNVQHRKLTFTASQSQLSCQKSHRIKTKSEQSKPGTVHHSSISSQLWHYCTNTILCSDFVSVSGLFFTHYDNCNLRHCKLQLVNSNLRCC